MAERSENGILSLELSSREGVRSFVYELKIPNLFTLAHYDGTVFESPTFEFANASWGFRFYTKQKWRRGEARDFSVSMVRLKSEKTRTVVFYKVTLLDADDEKYDEEGGVRYFNGDYKDKKIAYFNNGESFFDKREALSLIIQLFTDKVTSADVDQLENTDFSNEQKNGPVSLRVLPIKFTSSAIYTLNMPNFFTFTFPEYDEIVYRSRTFAFSNAAWCFEISSNRRWTTDRIVGRRGFSLAIIKIDSEILEQYISYTTTFLDGNDEEYYIGKAGTNCFRENIDDELLAILGNDIIPFDERDNLTLIIRLFSHELSPELRRITDKDTKALFGDFRKLLLNRKNYDFVLKVADEEFLVHRNVLMARSPVFLAMLSQVEKNDGFIYLPDCEPRAMEQFLFYVYTGKVENLNRENALGLYYVADKYSMTLLRDQCSEFIKNSLSPSIVCGAVQLALNHSDGDLLDCATKYFVNRVHFEESQFEGLCEEKKLRKNAIPTLFSVPNVSPLLTEKRQKGFGSPNPGTLLETVKRKKIRWLAEVPLNASEFTPRSWRNVPFRVI